MSNRFAVFDCGFADLTDLDFRAADFLFVQNFDVFPLAYRASTSAMSREFPDPFTPVRFGHTLPLTWLRLLLPFS